MADGYRVSQTTNNYENNFEKRISHTDAKWNHKIKDESLMTVMECFFVAYRSITILNYCKSCVSTITFFRYSHGKDQLLWD